MPQLIERARQVAALFSGHSRASVIPDPPQTSMFHLRLEGEEEELLEARDRVAREMGIWLFNNLKKIEGQAAMRSELSMGASSLTLGDDELAAAITLLI